jgi:hypothetical protein
MAIIRNEYRVRDDDNDDDSVDDSDDDSACSSAAIRLTKCHLVPMEFNVRSPKNKLRKKSKISHRAQLVQVPNLASFSNIRTIVHCQRVMLHTYVITDYIHAVRAYNTMFEVHVLRF